MSERVTRARFILYIYDDKDHIQLVYFEMERTNEWISMRVWMFFLQPSRSGCHSKSVHRRHTHTHTHQASRIYLFSSFHLTFPSIKNGLLLLPRKIWNDFTYHEGNLIRISGKLLNMNYVLFHNFYSLFMCGDACVCTNKRFIFPHLRRVSSRNMSLYNHWSNTH